VKCCPPDPWWVKIADFGISKRIEDELGSASTIKGTLQFMAPELFSSRRNGKSSTPRDLFASDIWAVGCITFLMLTKSTPFQDIAQLLDYSRNNDKLPRLLLEDHRVSHLAQRFISLLLARSPEQRPNAASALNHEWIQHEMTAADTSGWDEQDLNTDIHAQSQLEYRTPAIWTKEMQSWTTNRVEKTWSSRETNDAINSGTNEAILSHHIQLRSTDDMEDNARRYTSKAGDVPARPGIHPRRTATKDILQFETRRSRASPSERDYDDREDEFAHPPKEARDLDDHEDEFAPTPKEKERIYNLAERLAERRRACKESESDRSCERINHAVDNSTDGGSLSHVEPLTSAEPQPEYHQLPYRFPSSGISTEEEMTAHQLYFVRPKEPSPEPKSLPASLAKTSPSQTGLPSRGGFPVRPNAMNRDSPSQASRNIPGTQKEEAELQAQPRRSGSPRRFKSVRRSNNIIRGRKRKRKKAYSMTYASPPPSNIRSEVVSQTAYLEHYREKITNWLSPVKREEAVKADFVEDAYLRGSSSLSTISFKDLSVIKSDIIRALNELDIKYIQNIGGFDCWGMSGGTSRQVYKFKIFVAKVPHLSSHCIEFKNVDRTVMMDKVHSLLRL
jgi:protein kinase-like protein